MIAFFYSSLEFAVALLTILFITVTSIDVLLLFSRQKGISGRRILPEKFSNGDENPVQIHLKNYYPFTITTEIVDEIPFQFQKRDFSLVRTLKSQRNISLEYTLRPTERGEYHFGGLNIFVRTPFQLLSRKYQFDYLAMVPTYPSFIQLRKFDLLAMAYRNEYGIKKIRRIGHTMEFEQIKNYVTGDDIRTINWKATAKKSQLMVNQFQDEKSQPIYSVIDKGRVMKMPFDGLTLLDYAINASLVISNVSIKKHDKAGLLCFSKKIENRVVAERRSNQMHQLMEMLYNIKTDFYESDFGRLYADLRQNLKQRSLLFLYTNFETLDGMDRQLTYLQAIAKQHVLVVVFFVNTELEQLIRKKTTDTQEIYHQSVSEQFAFEKRLIVKELEKRGVYSILTTPQQLTLKVINKYLELKARGIV